jgi:hypothetical protein
VGKQKFTHPALVIPCIFSAHEPENLLNRLTLSFSVIKKHKIQFFIKKGIRFLFIVHICNTLIVNNKNANNFKKCENKY